MSLMINVYSFAHERVSVGSSLLNGGPLTELKMHLRPLVTPRALVSKFSGSHAPAEGGPRYGISNLHPPTGSGSTGGGARAFAREGTRPGNPAWVRSETRNLSYAVTRRLSSNVATFFPPTRHQSDEQIPRRCDWPFRTHPVGFFKTGRGGGLREIRRRSYKTLVPRSSIQPVSVGPRRSYCPHIPETPIIPSLWFF